MFMPIINSLFFLF